jgi:hypothetical protein
MLICSCIRDAVSGSHAPDYALVSLDAASFPAQDRTGVEGR